MIALTIAALLGVLVAVHVYASVHRGQDFIGDLVRHMLYITRFSFKPPPAQTTQFWVHPSDTGVSMRRLALPETRLGQVFVDPGPKKTDGDPIPEPLPDLLPPPDHGTPGASGVPAVAPAPEFRLDGINGMIPGF